MNKQDKQVIRQVMLDAPLAVLRASPTGRCLAAWLYVAFALVCIVGASARAAEPVTPAKPAERVKPAGGSESSRKAFEGLGFSMAPKEGGKGRTSLFGVVGEGYKFVYVIDRSGSMGGDGRKSLEAVKAEVIHSLERLDSVHQFQIVLYNERPVVFNPTGTPGRLAFATDENKRRASEFLDTITAQGGTAHEDALRLAIRLQPDVIFLLTDGDDPKLETAQLAKIRHLAAGIIINAVEFGSCPRPEKASFLADLAEQNGGKYAYIDISKHKVRKPAKP